MVGLIQRLLLELVQQELGDDGLKRVLAQAGIPSDREFRIDTSYSDEEFQRLLQATMSQTGLDQDQLEKRYASYFLADAQRRWPMWFKMSGSAREFLLRQPKIHNGFASSMKNEEDRSRINDKFHFEEHPHHLVVHYRSPNHLCGLFKYLVMEVLELYGETACIDESLCMKQGDDECCISVSWEN